jgi:hypothetical protein
MIECQILYSKERIRKERKSCTEYSSDIACCAIRSFLRIGNIYLGEKWEKNQYVTKKKEKHSNQWRILEELRKKAKKQIIKHR